MRCVIALLGLLFTASAAFAQSTVGVLGGYTYAHPSFESFHLSTADSMNGWFGGIDVPIANNLGILARTDGSYGDRFRQGIVIRPLGDPVRTALYTVTAGPRASLTLARLTLFADGLVGVAHGKARNMGIDFLSVAEDTKFVGGVGGGVELRVTRLLDLQADVQYRRTNLFDQTLNVVQVGTGIVLRPTRR
jgi:hypothetical protein